MTKTMQPTRDETLLDALRSNLRLLHELTMRYGVEIQPARPADDRPTILCPDDVRQLVAPEMAGLAQEQVRILLLDSRNHVVGQRVIYQGNVNSAMVRPAEVLRPAVVAAIPAHHHLPQPSQRRSHAQCGRHRADQTAGGGGRSCWEFRLWTTWSSAATGP